MISSELLRFVHFCFVYFYRQVFNKTLTLLCFTKMSHFKVIVEVGGASASLSDSFGWCQMLYIHCIYASMFIEHDMYKLLSIQEMCSWFKPWVQPNVESAFPVKIWSYSTKPDQPLLTLNPQPAYCRPTVPQPKSQPQSPEQ